jgi:hypothetical protein
MSNEVKEILKDLKGKNFNGLNKDDRTYMVYENMHSLVDFYIKKGHKAHQIVDEIFDRFENPKVAKAFTRIVKTQDEYPLDLGTATVLADFLEKRHQKIDEELVEQYSNVIDKILKKRIKKLNKKLGLEKDLLKELLVVVSEPDAISDPRFVGIYVQRMLRKLYVIAKDNETGLEDVKSVKKLFKALFGEDLLNDIAVNILLERKDFIRNFNESQKSVWNLMTNFALETLEKNKKKELKELVAYYVVRRAKDAKRDRDSARRIQFAQISEEDYPRLHAVAEKLSEDDENSKFL